MVIWTKIFFFYSSFLRTNDKNKARLTDKSLMNTLRICPRLADKSLMYTLRICPLDVDNSLMNTLRICPLDVDKSLMHCPSNNCIFPHKIVKTLVNFTKFDFFRKVLFKLLENSKGISGTFLSLSLRPWLQKIFPRFPFFYFGILDNTSIRRGQICPQTWQHNY